MKLLLLGWAGADWRLIQPLIDAGRMPHLASLMARGVIGNLLTLAPDVAPSQWASIATGRRADAHGILDWTVPDPDGLGLRPVTSGDLQAAPLWQRVSAAGRRAAVIGWPASHPALGSDAALVVSDGFAEARGKDFDHWPLAADAVTKDAAAITDPELCELFSDLRLHPTEVSAEQLLPFVPQAALIDQETDERLPLLAATLARASSIHAAATWAAEHHHSELLAVHFDLIERLSGAFMQYRAPRMAHVTERDFEVYREVVDGAYRFMDLLLGRYLELIGPDTHVMLVSDHGVVSDALRPTPSSRRLMNAEHRELGVFLLAGPGVKPDQLLFGATLLDIAPTALALLGLPPAAELEGRVLDEAFERPEWPGRFNVPAAGDPSMNDRSDRHPPAPQQDWIIGRLSELVALGYLPRPSADPEQAAEQAGLRQLCNHVQVLMSGHRHQQALPLLEQILALDPEHNSARLQQAQCHFALGDTTACRRALDDLSESGLRGPRIESLYGQLCVKEGDTDAALAHLQRAEDGGVVGRHLLECIGRTHLQAGHWPQAEQVLRKALAIDPEFAAAHGGLGTALAAQGRNQQAVKHLRRSLGILQQQPDIHYRLAQALAALGQHDEALASLQRALAIAPQHHQADKLRRRLQMRRSQQLIDSALANDGSNP